MGEISPAMRHSIALESALKAEDWGLLVDLLGNPASLAGTNDGYTGTNVLELALGWCGIEFVARMLDHGADPNFESAGFPSLHCALDRHEPGERYGLLELLLARGADVEQRGFNDYTPLHLAAANGDLRAIQLLLDHGADVQARTRIDDYETALEIAEVAGQGDAVRLLREAGG